MELLTPTEAAALVGVSDRTLRKWAEKGRIQRHEGPEGSVRYDRAELLSVRVRGAEDSGTVPEVGQGVPESGPEAAVGMPPIGPSWAEVAESHRKGQAEAEASLAELRAELFRKQVELSEVQAEVAALREAREERDFLRERLVESEKGEAELRVLLLNSQQALQAAEERLALPMEVPAPPAPDPVPEPAKRPWWQPSETPATGQGRPWWKWWGR